MSKVDDPIRIYATVHGASTVIPTGMRQLIGGWIEFQTKPNATEYVRGDIAAEMLEALRLHKAWSDSENSGPDYGGQTRDTHPDGERIWRAWWNNNLDLCDRAQKATEAALSKATGGE